MNMFRPQKRYQFRPPRYSPFLAPLLGKLSDFFYLRRKFRIRSITSEGLDRLTPLAASGHSILIAPNHADHADPHVLLHLGGEHDLTFHFMAARECFEASRFNAFFLQRSGAFSVDREGADLNAVKTAMGILRKARYPLVIFPEGEIYHHQERLDPLNEGVANILFRAAEKLSKGKSPYLVPTAMRYTYDESARASFPDRLRVLEERIGWKPREKMDVVDRIYRLGSGILATKEVEFLGRSQPGELVDRLSKLRNSLVALVEGKHLREEGSGSIPERVKVLRGRIRKRLTDPKAVLSEEEKENLYDDLDTLFVAVQLYSYPGQYLREEPSVHRIAETILKLEEDVMGKAGYPSPRDVHVRFGEPVNVRTFLIKRSCDSKTGVGPLTAFLSEKINAMMRTA